LKSHRDDILKAEIVSLFSLLEKTFTEWWKNKDFFHSYGASLNITSEIENLLNKFKDINVKIKIKTSSSSIPEIDNCWENFINNNWRGWRKIKLNSEPKKFLQVLYGSCEGINSGIEKGSPSEENQISKFSDKPFLSTSFGTFKNYIDNDKLNKLRNDLFSNISGLDDAIKKFVKNEKILEKSISELLAELSDSDISILKLISLRIKIFNLICLLYKNIPSDSRFPANDTSLFDQAYMSTSLFKAALAGLLLNSSDEIDINNFDGQKFKWSILGIQYDKLGLSEKGLKAASIKWYRDRAKRVDDVLQKLIEVHYVLGNEVYRDETGIYFLVSEVIKKNENSALLKEMKKYIKRIFCAGFGGEVYPAVFLTEPSRGLMNLGYLIEKAKENFLKEEKGKLPALELKPIKFKGKTDEKEEDYYVHPDKNFINENDDEKKEPNTAIRICPICKVRLVFKSDLDKRNDPPICEKCHRRIHHAQVRDWLRNPDGETIWIDELQDKNGRIALVTLKFELEKWLNGDLVNSLVIRSEDFYKMKLTIKDVLKFIKIALGSNNNEIKKLSINEAEKRKCSDFVKLFDKKAFQEPFKSIWSSLEKDKNINNVQEDKGWRNIANTLLKTEKWMEDFAFFNRAQKIVVKNIKKNKTESFLDYDQKDGCKEHLYKIFIINYLRMLIDSIFLERSIGSKWEIFISKKLKDWDDTNNKPLNRKIDFKNRKIYWNNLKEEDIEFLANIILQFLLRKNPSPARLRRIWETTREFFEELESEIITIADIKSERQKRLFWENINISDGEYQDGSILFWAKNETVYLITSIEKLGNKDKFSLKKYKDKDSGTTVTLDKQNAKHHDYKPYFTILSPTPISWQFIIPAENVPILIKKIQEKYYKNFRWVYGKLPLHIGIVVQNYKKPLYTGIHALRKIRRDSVKWEYLGKELSAKEIKSRQKEAFNHQIPPEQTADCEKFYSYFEKTSGEGKYEFYLYPNRDKKWLDITQGCSDTDEFIFYPNTFDFEFLDSNTRRNDIYYESGKRLNQWKRYRPYDISDWQYFEKFEDYFLKGNKSSSKLQKLVSLIYSKLEDWDDDESLKKFILSAFVNVLELKNGEKRNAFASVLGVENFEDLERMEAENFREKLYLLIDMFEFWHTMLKHEGKNDR
jgi:hypothetical protein